MNNNFLLSAAISYFPLRKYYLRKSLYTNERLLLL